MSEKIAITLLKDNPEVSDGLVEAVMGNTAAVQVKSYYASQVLAQRRALEAMENQLHTPTIIDDDPEGTEAIRKAELPFETHRAKGIDATL